ncbi:conserved hypothetical protein [Verticillium alfalfae VaMs.102]|uniref:Uncharacterized protein n=1 Tax=Verticillium alfalfae (strain VaMs.102 / ATCC MYA-4576 / FGSC 10136) TaxID=526221 RepID=C9SMV6_VERA1|nr:conserved hypothetical protein [Verticillium alfalfae VaMs.102]EEY20121.1 conserved hypothetical protein [Verticillium alfalfae VaMs.102]
MWDRLRPNAAGATVGGAGAEAAPEAGAGAGAGAPGAGAPQKMTMAPARQGRDVSPFAFPYDNTSTGVTTTITANAHWTDDFHATKTKTKKTRPGDASPSLSSPSRLSGDDDNVSPIEEAPVMSQLDIAKQHHRRFLEDHQRKQQQQQELEKGQRQPQQASPSPHQRSQIPMMRRDRRKQQDNAASQLRETRPKELLHGQPSQTTRWDDQTGKPIHDGSPSHQPHQQLPPAATQRNPMKAFGDRVRKMRPAMGDGNSAKPAISAPITAPMSIDERPGWRGASGRQTFVQSVQDTPQVAPIHIPRKSSKRAATQVARAGGVTSPLSPISPSSESETSAAATTPTGPRVAPMSLDRPLPTPPPPAAQETALSYLTPPTSEGAVQPPIHAMPTLGDQAADANQQPGSLPLTPNRGPPTKAIRRKPPPTNPLGLNPHNAHAPHASFSSSVYSTQLLPDAAEDPSPQPAATTSDDWVQPPSRFSVTTFATSVNAGSPRTSSDADLPSPADAPSSWIATTSAKEPRKPRINADEPFKISMSSAYTTSPDPASPSLTTARQKLPSQVDRPAPRSSVNSGIYNATNGRPESILSLSKALPPAPPELSSVNDRVGHLNARLSSLGNRRININMAIKQMTELMPTDNLLASEAVLRKREAEKRKVRGAQGRACRRATPRSMSFGLKAAPRVQATRQGRRSMKPHDAVG